MNIYISMYVCMYICIYACMYVCMYVFIYILSMWVNMYVMYVYKCMYMYARRSSRFEQSYSGTFSLPSDCVVCLTPSFSQTAVYRMLSRHHLHPYLRYLCTKTCGSFLVVLCCVVLCCGECIFKMHFFLRVSIWNCLK